MKKLYLLLLAVMCSVGQLWAWNISNGVTIYFDNEDTKWSSVEMHIWADGWGNEVVFEKIEGTDIWKHTFDGGYQNYAGFKFHEGTENWGASNSSVNDINTDVTSDVFFNGQSIDMLPTDRSSHNIYLLGLDSWEQADSRKITLSNYSGSITFNLAANTEYEFKIKTVNGDNEAWFGNSGKMELDNCSGWNFRNAHKNCKIKTTIAGDYTINVSWGMNGKNWYPTVSVDYPGQAITISAAGYTTYYNSKKAYTMPEGVEGYIFDANQKKIVSTYAAGSVVPAGEALVLKGAPATYQLLFADGGNHSANNALLGTDTQTELEADNNSYFYALTLNAAHEPESVGFYWMNATGAAFTNGAHKAYLKLAKEAGVQNHYTFADEVTAVENVEATDVVKFIENGQVLIKKNGAVYNVMGQIVK